MEVVERPHQRRYPASAPLDVLVKQRPTLLLGVPKPLKKEPLWNTIDLTSLPELDGAHLPGYALTMQACGPFALNEQLYDEVEVWCERTDCMQAPAELLPYASLQQAPELWRKFMCTKWSYSAGIAPRRLGMRTLVAAFSHSESTVLQAVLKHNAMYQNGELVPMMPWEVLELLLRNAKPAFYLRLHRVATQFSQNTQAFTSLFVQRPARACWRQVDVHEVTMYERALLALSFCYDVLTLYKPKPCSADQ